MKIRHILDDDNIIDSGGIFKLSDKGKMIGYLIWDCNGKHIELCDLLLHDEVDRGCGYGSKLVIALLEHAKTINAKTIHGTTAKDNKPVHRFYEKHGFHFVTPRKFSLSLT